MRAAHPGQILKKPKWAWNNVGGIYARFMLLHCSLKEYVGIFGTNSDQAGFSGEYAKMNVYDIMLSGRMLSYDAPSKKSLPLVYLAGDISLLKKKETRVYTMDKHSYMIDYGRGNVPAAFWSGVIAPYLFVNHDKFSTKQQLTGCAKSIISSYK